MWVYAINLLHAARSTQSRFHADEEVMGRKGCLSDLTNVRGCAEFPVCKRWWFAPAWYRDKCLFKMQGSKRLDLCEDRQARSDSSLQAHLSNKAFIFIAVLKKLFSKEL